MKRAENRWALAEFSIRLTKRQTALRDALLERFLRGGPEPDTIEAVLDSIPPERREEARQVLESLLTGGELVRLSPELCWHREVFQKGWISCGRCVLTTALSRWQRSGTL